jgi:hypothetical protein
MTTVQAVNHHAATLNGTWLYRALRLRNPETGLLASTLRIGDFPRGTRT